MRSPSPRRRSPGQAARARPVRRLTTLVDWRAEADFIVLGALLVLVALGGGSAFIDTLSLLYVRLAAVVALAVFLLRPAPTTERDLRALAVLLALWAALMAVQLVPLPPSLWTALPGRAAYWRTAGLADTPVWRPWTLTPDLTLNSLVSLIVPAAVLAGFARLDGRRRRRLVIALIGLCVASIVLGIAQFAGGANSALYLYKRTHQGVPVGLLANRNHHAALLACLFPALRVWSLSPATDRRWRRQRAWLALALALFTVPVILATGSRAGIALGLVSIAVTVTLFPDRQGSSRSSGAAPDRRRMWLRLAVAAAALVMVALTWRFDRALSIQRLDGAYPAVDEDLRFQLAPVVLDITRHALPIGTGLGSFDPVFRQYEPDAALANMYFNHAHNDLLEVAMTAGLPGLALLLALLLWWAGATVRALRALRARGTARPASTALLGAIVIGVLLAASLVDYPLRTPLLGAWFAIACGWLATGGGDAPLSSGVAAPDRPV